MPTAAKPTHGTSTATTSAPAPTATAHVIPGHGKPGHPKVITLTVADNGKTIHVVLGEQVAVRLAVKLKHNPTAATWWHAVTESGETLKVLPSKSMAQRGVTKARYDAVAPGNATLSSSRTGCPSHPGTPTCHSMQSWQVSIEVR